MWAASCINCHLSGPGLGGSWMFLFYGKSQNFSVILNDFILRRQKDYTLGKGPRGVSLRLHFVYSSLHGACPEFYPLKPGC